MTDDTDAADADWVDATDDCEEMEELIEAGVADVVAGATAVVDGAEVEEGGVVTDETLVVAGGFEVILDETAPTLLPSDVVSEEPVPSDTFCRLTKLIPSTLVVIVEVDVPKASRPNKTKVCLQSILIYDYKWCGV